MIAAAGVSGWSPLAVLSALVSAAAFITCVVKAGSWAGGIDQRLTAQDKALAEQDKVLAKQDDVLDAQSVALAELHTKLDALMRRADG